MSLVSVHLIVLCSPVAFTINYKDLLENFRIKYYREIRRTIKVSPYCFQSHGNDLYTSAGVQAGGTDEVNDGRILLQEINHVGDMN